jgi:hypothetical protein
MAIFPNLAMVRKSQGTNAVRFLHGEEEVC